jgi:hypothetical protein
MGNALGAARFLGLGHCSDSCLAPAYNHQAIDYQGLLKHCRKAVTWLIMIARKRLGNSNREQGTCRQGQRSGARPILRSLLSGIKSRRWRVGLLLRLPELPPTTLARIGWRLVLSRHYACRESGDSKCQGDMRPASVAVSYLCHGEPLSDFDGRATLLTPALRLIGRTDLFP